mmetsp:Transcript_21056/g.34228  ORF Transcript_21056/g.34228 Transcript_21056/m.34228 type:complete len:939 (+) Transcript_21056:270-3086(+)|eukprot:CAMPEP_0196130352 /NCGR_PEP_ID=MMETSP0910-20130528/755_1 /TAXON_ID=49265 /ORGANISM="Thalassiosira rotula, Strain GSO102" /LENGTH=938 /DNA_ID=CAMNT_0041389645 /DNA_START=917 /DNA_END=3733 /DNA_ORIENTATION=+
MEKIQSLLSVEENVSEDEGMANLQNYVFQLIGVPNLGEIESRISKLRQKVALLPRLAETLSSRIVTGDRHAVSENDWDVYLETLLVQDKKREALEAIAKIRGTPMSCGDGDAQSTSDDNHVPQIDDEHTIENHVGSLLPYTQRKKLERMAGLSRELGMHGEAEGCYRELLLAFPDQWTYWLGLLDACSALTDEEGWKRCWAFAEEAISTVEGGQKYALRGPYLVLLELASVKVQSLDNGNSATDAAMMTALRDEIFKYGNKFGPVASCCFADVRSYLGVLVTTSSPPGTNDPSKDVLHVLQWAKELWTANFQSNDSADVDVSPDEFRERRKKIRTFIFAVQVIYGIAAELHDSTAQLLQTYAPSESEMVTEWRTSLSFLPGVAPKDGGQKEVLPGDEIVLLTSQYLQFHANEAKLTPVQQQQSSYDSTSKGTITPRLLCAAGLLEEAMDHSPYNPHLKIASIGIYSQLHAAHRALTIYQDLGVKQIQLDSCSYLILPTLIRGGLYTSAIKLSTSILRLHGSTSKEVKDYATRALRNGLLFKAKEMATFQKERMRPSLQLLQSKGLVMDAAPLMILSDLGGDIMAARQQQQKGGGRSILPVRLGAEKGYCGNVDEDATRAEKIAIDAEGHFNAPSILHAVAQLSPASLDDFVSSDNRDMTVNSFEILHHNSHSTQGDTIIKSLRRGQMHGLLTRAIMVADVAIAPKKGKVPKSTDETVYRCHSLRHSLLRAKEFLQGVDMDGVDRVLWEACCQLCEAIIVVIHGSDGGDKSDDTLASREKAAASIIDSTTQLVQSARTSEGCSPSTGARICQLLPDRIVPLFVLLETVAGLFSRFGWGKRKRNTKAASGALADLALTFRDLLSDMLCAMSQYRSFGGGHNTVGVGLESLIETGAGLGVVEEDSIRRALKEIISSRELTEERVDPFLAQMRESLNTFEEP